jgi:hypothetical protein
MTCQYCRGVRTACVCLSDCGARDEHICPQAPLAERMAWVENFNSRHKLVNTKGELDAPAD